MANAKGHVKIDLKVVLELDEEEARALSGIFGYGVDPFLKAFYKEMGKAYVQPYEKGVRRLHERIRGLMDHEISKIDDVRRKLSS
jgi:hypothetical protein